jgi:UDP-3-O-[3-hydroxymyristoyl] glucosamine N-acyltransferase
VAVVWFLLFTFEVYVMNIAFKKAIFASELADKLSLEILGDKLQIFQRIANINCPESNAIKFSKFTSDQYLRGVIIGPASLNAETLLVSDNPRLDFCKALHFLIDSGCVVISSRPAFVHHSATVADTAILEEGVSIGAHTIVEHNVVIHKNTSIGEKCIIRSNTVIGAQGFGFEQKTDGTWIRFPHLGRVIIEDRVEIGALNSICVGALDDTVVGAGVKTDNLVHIAHNCNIGENCIITACSELSGGVCLGENVWIGPNSSVTEKVSIGKNSLVGIGSVVRKNVDENSVVAGSPAKLLRKK